MRPTFRLSPLAIALALPVPALANTISFGEATFNLLEATDPLRYGYDSGDDFIANFSGSTTIGGITGRRNQQITPAVKAFGKTIIPAIRADTRSGLRLTPFIDGYAGVRLTAGMTLSQGIDLSFEAGPRLTLPNEIRAGESFRLLGSTFLGAGGNFDTPLPSFDAGLDVVLGGSAGVKVEVGAFPLLGYRVGDFGFSFPDINLPVFDLNLDLNLPRLPDFNFLDLPDLIPENDKDNSLISKKLPPSNPLLSAGEVVLVNPVTSASTVTTSGADGITSTTKGEIMRLGIDIDGLASFATTGVSFTGLKIPIEIRDTEVGNVKYDIIDVKYGVELGYEVESRFDAFLEATLSFVDPDTLNPVDVLIDTGEGFERLSSFAGRWDQLPEMSLLSAGDVQMNIDFTGFKQQFQQRGALTLSDYLELAALEARASIRFGLGSVGFGPLLYQKLALAGEFASLDIYNETFTLSDLGITDGLWDSSVLLSATGGNAAYLANAFQRISAANLRSVDAANPVTALADTVLTIGTGSAAAVETREQVAGVNYRDEGETRLVSGIASVERDTTNPFQRFATINFSNVTIADTSTVTDLSGLYVPGQSTYTLDRQAARNFRLFTVENDGLITGLGRLTFQTAVPDGDLGFEGDGITRFQSAGGIEAGVVRNGEGHTLSFAFVTGFETGLVDAVDDLIPDTVQLSTGFGTRTVRQEITDITTGNSALDTEFDGARDTSRWLRASVRLENAGTLQVTSSTLTPEIAALVNEDTGRIVAGTNGQLTLAPTSRSISNAGIIEAAGSGASIDIDTGTLIGSADKAAPGLLVARSGGEITVRNSQDPIVTTDPKTGSTSSTPADLIIQSAVASVTEAGSTTRFENNLTLSDRASLQLVNDAGGTLELNGLLRTSETASIDIVNLGLLDVVSGTTSLRVRSGGNGPRNPGSTPPTTTVIRPVDLVNEGTVRIREGAEFAFDIDLVSYNEGGASLGGGAWEVLGAAVRTSNLAAAGAESAVLDLRVRDVFGAAGTFADLTFDEQIDPDTGEVRISDIGNLDSRLVFNDSSVTLGGAASFSYFNTVEVNRGLLRLKDMHQFTTATGFENRGGTTQVESGAGLHVSGGLLVNGGTVSFSGNSEFSVAGEDVAILALDENLDVIDSGETFRRDIEVNGGQLLIAEGTVVQPDLIDRGSRSDGLVLAANRSWVVRETMFEDEAGNVTVNQGRIDLGVRNEAGVAGIVRNEASVTLDGAEAHFEALEGSLEENAGSLSLLGGKALISDKAAFDNTGSLELAGAAFTLANGVLRNTGSITLDDNAYLEAQRLEQLGGSFTLNDGVVNVDEAIVRTPIALEGGAFNARSIDLDGSGEFVLNGGTLFSLDIDGSLFVNGGVFAPGQSIADTLVSGDFLQEQAGTMQIEWDDTGADFVEIAGNAQLGGILELALLNDFLPQVGTSIEFFRAASILGSFVPEIRVAGQNLGVSFALRQEGSSLFLDVNAAPVPLPAGVWLFGGALGVLPGLRSRRRAAPVSA